MKRIRVRAYKKKSGNQPCHSRIVLITATLNLIIKLIELIEKLIE